MPDRIDARVPVRLATAIDITAEEATLVLVDEDLNLLPPPGRIPLRPARFAPPHEEVLSGTAPSCACCTGRSPFATELGALFTERATGTAPFFRAILAVGTKRGLEHARAALATDPLLLGRYRLADVTT